MQIIKNQSFPLERALYHQDGLRLISCRFEGKEDGESALKECSNIEEIDCFHDLRYPFWHDKNLKIEDCELTANCRAALWYCDEVEIKGSALNGIKALRECSNIKISKSTSISPEFGWRCKNIHIDGFSLKSEYPFFECQNIEAIHLSLEGKYSIQYVERARFTHSNFKTKDAFWHSKNVTVEDSLIEGEYLGWYSENLTLIRCEIVGTQPLCYCKGLKLIDCTMKNCDRSFENSEVEATITGSIDSITNPRSGHIKCESVGEIEITKNDPFPSTCVIEETSK